MPMQLPVEIIGRIIQLIYLSSSKRKAILPLLLVSPTFRIETERLLYAHICLRTLAQVVRCFHTINSRPNIPRTVRQLHISLELNSSPRTISLFDFLNVDGTILNNEQVQRFRDAREAKHTGKVLRPFGVLVDRTLNKLTSLQEYSLSLGGGLGRDEPVFAPMWLPPQAPFKLRRFIVDLNLSPAMTRFLQSQSSITDLLAPHFSHQPNRLPLPPGTLPKLRGLVVSPEVASSIVPGRPVKRVVLKPPRRGSGRIIDSTLSAIPFLAQSSIPVKSIDIVVPQPSVTAELLLRPLAAGLPHLEHLILRRGFFLPHELSVYETYESDAFTGALADFRNLKTLQVPAPSAWHHLREAGILNEMIDVAGGAGITIQANINGQIFAGPPPPPPPVPPMAPVVFGPPLPPNFPNPNGNGNDIGNLGPAPGPGAGAGGGIQGIGGGFFAIPLAGGFLGGGGMVPPLPPLPAGLAPGNAGNPPPPPPPAAGPGAGLPAFFQNLFGFDQPPPNQNANGNEAGPLPPAPAQGQALGPNFDDVPPLMDDPGEGEVVADFFVVTAGPMEGEGGNPNEQDANPEGQEPQPPQGDANPLAQPAGANAGPPPPPPLFNLNQVLNQATNMIMQQLQNHLQAQLGGVMGGGPGGGAAGGPANPNPAAPPANANVNAAPAAGANPLPGLVAATTPDELDDLPPLGPLGILEPAEPAANLGAAGAAPPPPPPPPGPAAPLNFQTTFLTAWNPVTGEMVVDAGPADPHEATPPPRSRTRDFKDGKVVEILDKAQRELKARELKILDKWKLGGYAPGLKTVMFDMEPTVRRRTIWTWKESATNAPHPTSSRLTTVSDGDDDGDVSLRNVDEDEVEANSSVGGTWEVEYVDKGVY